jgi:hypothetical protein
MNNIEEILSVLGLNKEFGSISDINKPYILLEYGNLYMKLVFIGDNDELQKVYENHECKYERVLLLKNIYIPEKDRKKGYCRKIVNFLYERAKKEKCKFMVGPIMSYEKYEGLSPIEKVCKKLNMKTTVPFSYIS